MPLIIVGAGVIAIAAAFGLYQLRWTVESAVEIVEDTKSGLNPLLIGLGVLAFAFGATKILRTFK